MALNAVCGVSGILNYRGSILTAKDGITKVVPTIHPAALFSHGATDSEDSKGGLSWVWNKVIEADVIRATEESLTKSLILPERTLSIARNSLDVHGRTCERQVSFCLCWICFREISRYLYSSLT